MDKFEWLASRCPNAAERAAQAFPVWPLEWSVEERREATRTMLETVRLRLDARISAPANSTGSISLSPGLAIEISDALRTAGMLLG